MSHHKTTDDLWEHFLEGSPTAFDQLFGLLADPVFRRVRKQFPHLPADDIEDGVVRAFEALFLRPAAYQPGRTSLEAFLAVVAQRRVIDDLRKSGRRPKNKDDADDGVALPGPEANVVRGEGSPDELEQTADPERDTESEALAGLLFAGRDPAVAFRPEVEASLRSALPESRDFDLFLLTIDGRATVEEFAALFEVGDLPIERQRQLLKQNRDRVQKRVIRQRDALRRLLDPDQP